MTSWRIGRRIAAVALASALIAVPASAQTGAAESGWLIRATAAAYLLPDDDNYVQPTVAADCGRLHLEGRYNYENRHAISGFFGRNFALGKTVTLDLTPMFGVVVGDTNGVVPAVEFDLAWWRLGFSSESEYVIDVEHPSDRFYYNWSEGSVSIADWLRAGVVLQRTRAYRTPRDVQRGALIGGTISKLEWAVYFFNPGSDDHFVVTSIGVTF